MKKNNKMNKNTNQNENVAGVNITQFPLRGYGVDMGQVLDTMDDINGFLGIELPRVTFDPNFHFATKSTMAAVSFGKDTTLFLNVDYFNDSFEFSPIHVFVLGHEMRHIFQRENNTGAFLNHKQSNKTSLQEYNEQWEEMDANAFGLMCVDIMYGSHIALDYVMEYALTKLSKDTRTFLLQMMRTMEIQYNQLYDWLQEEDEEDEDDDFFLQEEDDDFFSQEEGE